jgi:prepilin-type processing-associated H-X9-DG protein
MRRKTALALACWIAFLAPAARARGGESVVYAITSGPVSRTQLPKTEIFAVDPKTGRQRLVFSDANAPFFMLTGAIAAARGRIFAEGIERNSVATGTPALDPGPSEAVYELSTDGSGHARKVFDMASGGHRVDFLSLFFNSIGSEVGNIGFVDGHAYLFVRDTRTGQLLRKSELLGWRFGSTENVGWMPDDKRIFFTEAFPGGGPDVSWTTPGSLVGTYLLDADAAPAKRLAPEAELHPQITGMQPSNDSPAFLIGTLPDGGLLFHDYQRGPAGGGVYLYELNLARRTQKVFPLEAEGDPDAFHLSRSGDQLAFAGIQKEGQIAKLASVWLMEMKSGQQRRLLTFPPEDETHNVGRPWVNLIGWLEDK